MDGHLPQSGPRPRGEAPLLGHLMFCTPPESRKATAGSVALSVLGHGALLALAFYITSQPASSRRAPPTHSFDIVLPPERLPDVPPPPPVAGSVAASTAPAPIGFPTLDAPPTVPTDIPEIRPGPITNAGDYTGVGTPGGDPRGTVAPRSVTPDDPTVAPVFVPIAVQPELQNRDAVRRALVRLYPPMLRDAGMGGRVLVWALIGEKGEVIRALVHEGSGAPAMDAAALGVVQQMRFSPGINRDTPVKCWVALPIEFRVDR